MISSSLFAKCIAKVVGTRLARDAMRRFANAAKNKPSFHDELQKLVTEAETGDVEALYDLGMVYRNRVPEIQIERQAETAFDYILRAANLGHPDAQHRLALMYWRGEGTTKSESDALAWCRIAREEPKDIIGDKSAWEPQMSAPQIQEADRLHSVLVKTLPVMPRRVFSSELVAVGRPIKTP